MSPVREGRDRKRNKRRRNFEGDAGNEMMMGFLGNLKKKYILPGIYTLKKTPLESLTFEMEKMERVINLVGSYNIRCGVVVDDF